MDNIYLVLSHPGFSTLACVATFCSISVSVILTLLHLTHTASNDSFVSRIFNLEQKIAVCDDDNKILEMSATIGYLQKHLNRSKKHLTISVIISAFLIIAVGYVPSKAELMDRFLKQHDCISAMQLKGYLGDEYTDNEDLVKKYDKVCKE